MLQAGRSRVRVPMKWIFFNLPNPSSLTMAMGSTQPLNRNEYQGSSWRIKGGQRVTLTNLPPSVSRFSRQNVGASTSHKPMGLHGLLHGELYLFLPYIYVCVCLYELRSIFWCAIYVHKIYLSMCADVVWLFRTLTRCSAAVTTVRHCVWQNVAYIQAAICYGPVGSVPTRCAWIIRVVYINILDLLRNSICMHNIKQSFTMVMPNRYLVAYNILTMLAKFSFR
jgi:hypothetical protein